MSLRDVRPFSLTVTVPNSDVDYENICIGSPSRCFLHSLTVYAPAVNQPAIDIQIYVYDGINPAKRFVCGGMVWSSTPILINAGNVVLEKKIALARHAPNYFTVYYNNRDVSSWNIQIDGVFAR